MKQLNEWEFFIDDGNFGLYKEDEDGNIIEDDDGRLVEIDDETPITYGMLKEMILSFADGLKSDLKDIEEMIPDND